MKVGKKIFSIFSGMAILLLLVGNVWALEDYTWPQAGPPVAELGLIQDLSATPGNGQVTLNWTADAASDGYAIYYTDGSKTAAEIEAQALTTTDSTYTMTGLENETTYQFKIRNFSGSGFNMKIQTYSNLAEATPTAGTTTTTTPTVTTTTPTVTTTTPTVTTTTPTVTTTTPTVTTTTPTVTTTTPTVTTTTPTVTTTTVPPLPSLTDMSDYKFDVNGDGEVNSLDAALIIRYIQESGN